MKRIKNFIFFLVCMVTFYSCSSLSANSKSKKPTGEVIGHIYNYSDDVFLRLPTPVILFNMKRQYQFVITKSKNKEETQFDPLFFFKNVIPDKYTLVVGDTFPGFGKEDRFKPAYVNNDTIKNFIVSADSINLISFTYWFKKPSGVKQVILPKRLLTTTGSIVGSFDLAKYKDITKCKYRGAYVDISGYSGDSLVSRGSTADSLGNFQFKNLPIGFYKISALIRCPERFQHTNGEPYYDFAEYDAEYYRNVFVQPNKTAVVQFTGFRRGDRFKDHIEAPLIYTEWPLKYLD